MECLYGANVGTAHCAVMMLQHQGSFHITCMKRRTETVVLKYCVKNKRKKNTLTNLFRHGINKILSGILCVDPSSQLVNLKYDGTIIDIGAFGNV